MDFQELKNYSNFNEYANKLIYSLLSPLSLEELEQNIENSFPSIISTIAHIWGAEFLWLERLKGKNPRSFPLEDFKGDSYGILDEFKSTSIEFNNYVQAITEELLVEKLDVTTTKGLKFYHSRYQIIHHTINHSTQHRGQIITMCRQIGIKQFEPIDYIWYLRNLQLEKK